MEEKIENIKFKFKKCYQEIDSLSHKIHAKDGLLLKEHRYGIEELIDGDNIQKINAITAKIGSDISYGEAAGKLSDWERQLYNRKEIT